VPVGARHRRFEVELVPDGAIAGSDRIRGLDGVLECVGSLLHDAEVGEPEADVLDEDVEVIRALAV
jgi:hypothetical protein